MLKKLVKYGNSTALVLDKAILELLNIEEGSVVKIKTDGISLTITPQTKIAEEKISPTITYLDAVKDSAFDQIIKQYPDLSLARRADLKAELQSLHAQRRELLDSTAGLEFVKALQELQQKKKIYHTSPKFQKEYTALRDQLIPQLANLDNQLLNFEKKHKLDTSATHMPPDCGAFGMRHNVPEESMQQLRDAYAELFKKHAIAREKLTQIANNPDFIHETQLLVDKNGGKLDIGTPEFTQLNNEIRYKYVPEARAMDKEMIEIGKKILCGNPTTLQQ